MVPRYGDTSGSLPYLDAHNFVITIGGDQTLNGNDDQDNTLFGDAQTFADFFDGSTVWHAVGGVDELHGGDSTVAGGDIENFLAGDAWEMFDSSEGGDDDYLYGGQADGGSTTNLLYGDAFFMFGSSKGGDDKLFGGHLLTTTGGSINNILVGDADEMLDGSSGGVDELTGGNLGVEGTLPIAADYVSSGLVSNHLHGDAQRMQGAGPQFAIGDDDILRGGNNYGGGDVDNFLYGDAFRMDEFSGGGDDTLYGGDNYRSGTIDNNMYGDGELIHVRTFVGDDFLYGGSNRSTGSGEIVNRLYGDGFRTFGGTAGDIWSGGDDYLQGGNASFSDYIGIDVHNDLSGDLDLLRGNDTGGNDTIRGGESLGPGAYTENLISGDAHIMAGSAKGGNDFNSDDIGQEGGLIGGDADISGFVFNQIVGDALFMFDTASGGNDRLRGGDAKGNGRVDNFLYGDAITSDPGVIHGSDLLIGGNLDTGGSLVFNRMWGNGGADEIQAGRNLTHGGIVYNQMWGEDGDDLIHIAAVDPRTFDTSVIGAYDRRENLADGGEGKDTLKIYANGITSNNAFGGGHFWVEKVVDYQDRDNKVDEQLGPYGVVWEPEILISYTPSDGVLDSKIVAHVANIEDITIDLVPLPDVDPQYVTVGDLSGTSIGASTITINGSASDDIVDLIRLDANHSVKLFANGGNDVIMGGNAITKVILSSAFSTYQQIINPDGTLTLSAGPNNSFTTDNHDIIIQDPNNQGAVDFNIAPVAKNDSFTTNEDTPLTGNLLANNGNGADSDFDNDQLTVQAAIFLTAHGSVNIAANGSFTYVPTLDFFGIDSFTYTVGDGQATDSATATVQVLDVNDPAAIGGDVTGSVIEDTTLITTGTLTISDVDSPESFLAGPYEGAHGTLDLTESGEWEYYVYNASGAVQALDSGDTLTDEVVIQSADSTEQTISITINGIDEQKGNPNGQTVDGTRGNDTITTGNGSDVVNGLPGDDVISTGQQDDLVQAGAGDDTVYAGHGDDTVYGDAGDDTLVGEQGADEIHGGTGDDTIHGGNDGDTLFGDAGQDQLFGEHGDDVLDPGAGSDIMTGGLGNDVFVLDLDGSLDEVTDFEDDVDQIQLPDGIAFADLTIEDGASGGVSISVAGNEEMLLQNIADAAQITTDDFFVS